MSMMAAQRTSTSTTSSSSTAGGGRQGWLLKRGDRGLVKSWKLRWFSLEPRTPRGHCDWVLRYYVAEDDRRVPRSSLTGGVIDLSLTVPKTTQRQQDDGAAGDVGGKDGDALSELDLSNISLEVELDEGVHVVADSGSAGADAFEFRIKTRPRERLEDLPDKGGALYYSDEMAQRPPVPFRVWRLRARTAEDRDAWVEAIRSHAPDARERVEFPNRFSLAPEYDSQSEQDSAD